MCLYPRLGKNRKYTPTKKNGGVVPYKKDPRLGVVPIGCGKCMECHKQEANGWRTRLHIAFEEDSKAKFITLTFTTEALKEIEAQIGNFKGYKKDNAIAHKAIKLFLGRWKKKYGHHPKHWFITELGNGRWEHLHIHGMIWKNENQTIHDVWKYGRVDVGRYTNSKTINYITKYITKRDDNHKEYKPKIMATKGIGKEYIKSLNAKDNQYRKGETKEYFKTENGTKIALPKYLRNKIYTEEEREELWIEKLNKGERYINGIKIKEADKQAYYKLLERARKVNKELGYGDNSKDWSKEKYENDRRDMLYKKRLETPEDIRLKGGQKGLLKFSNFIGAGQTPLKAENEYVKNMLKLDKKEAEDEIRRIFES